MSVRMGVGTPIKNGSNNMADPIRIYMGVMGVVQRIEEIMTVKELKDWLQGLPEEHNIEVRLKGGWQKEFTLRIKYVKTIGSSQMSHQTAADDE